MLLESPSGQVHTSTELRYPDGVSFGYLKQDERVEMHFFREYRTCSIPATPEDLHPAQELLLLCTYVSIV